MYNLVETFENCRIGEREKTGWQHSQKFNILERQTDLHKNEIFDKTNMPPILMEEREN